MNDRDFMNIALDLARQGEGHTSPNPMVGAVVVKEDTIVGRGYHKALGGAHAEVNALEDAGDRAAGGTLYVTLEPCNHHGRTPPCTERIISAGLQRVVVAMADPNPDVTGGGIAYLTRHGVAVTRGVCEQEAKQLNETFVKFVATKRPFVLVKCAATLDGRIATRTGDARWVSGEASRAYVHRLRHAYDAILVGINTVSADDPSLTTRLEGMDGKDPVRIVLDSALRISENAKVLQPGSDSDTLIVTGDRSDEPNFRKKKDALEINGAKVLVAPLKDDRIDLDRLMDRLGAMEITSLLIEGGGGVIASAFAAGVVDKINFFYAPKILGGDDGVPICRGAGPESMRQCLNVKKMTVRRFGEDVMIEGYVDAPSAHGDGSLF
jgi:diaminohydroxyphosphoribosylaminopyrimidine deaminase / 5-amino-6-(5-phosphoribosylamino)uracil reductase